MPHQTWLHVAIMRHDKTVLAEYSLPLRVHPVPPKIPKAKILAKYVPGTKTAWKRASWLSWPPSAETLQNVISYWKRDVSSSGLEKEGLGVNLYGDAERHRILICCCGCLPAATATVTAASRMQQKAANRGRNKASNSWAILRDKKQIETNTRQSTSLPNPGNKITSGDRFKVQMLILGLYRAASMHIGGHSDGPKPLVFSSNCWCARSVALAVDRLNTKCTIHSTRKWFTLRRPLPLRYVWTSDQAGRSSQGHPRLKLVWTVLHFDGFRAAHLQQKMLKPQMQWQQESE